MKTLLLTKQPTIKVKQIGNYRPPSPAKVMETASLSQKLVTGPKELVKQLTILEQREPEKDPDNKMINLDNASMFRSKYASSGLSSYSLKKGYPVAPSSPRKSRAGSPLRNVNINVRPSPTIRMQDRTPSISFYEHSIQDIE